MTELFSDGFVTTLAAAVTTTVRPVTLAVSGTSPDLAGGTFSIIVYDAGTESSPTHAEVLEVTDGTTTSWSANTESGHTPVTHAAGSTVRLILTKRSLTQQMADHLNLTASPDPHTQYLRKASFGQKGDVLVGTSTGFTTEHVGANGTVLIADNTQSTGRRWGTIGFSGILQHMGDLIASGLAGVAQRLGIGTAGQVLTTIQNVAAIADPTTAPLCAATGTGGALINGSQYDFAYAWSNGVTPDGGTTKPSPIQVFTATATGTVSVTAPAAPAAGVTLIIYAAAHGGALQQQATLTNPSVSTTNTVNVASVAVGAATSVINTTGGLSPGWSTPAAGTITSVALSAPAEMSVSGSPLTGSGGTITLSKTQSASSFAVSADGTIPTTALASRVSPASAVVGIALQAGTYVSQECWIVNESQHNNSVTFASPTNGVAITPGTVSKTAGSATLIGISTTFTTKLVVGQSIIVSGGGRLEITTVSAIASDTSLTVSTPFNFTASGITAYTLQLSGTVAKTSGSAVLTGTGTAFTTQTAVGQLISVPGTSTEVKQIISIASDTSLTVDSNFSNSASAQTASLVSSNVADGSSAVIYGLSGFKFVWDSALGMWFHTGGSAQVMGANGVNHAAGLAPDPGATTFSSHRFLRDDALWTVPWTQGESGSIANGTTILVGVVTAQGISQTAPATGVILQAGVYGGQEFWLVNEGASANSITFAASGTSNVAGGASVTIPGGTALMFVWDVYTNLWYNHTSSIYLVFGASGASHSSGLVPDPGSSASATRFLREDATWQIPTGSGGTSGTGGSIVPIQTQTPSGVSSVIFGVPTGFRNLRLTVQARGDASAAYESLNLTFNGDTGTNYTYAVGSFRNGGAAAAGQATQANIQVGYVNSATAPANLPSALEITIPNHAATTFYKNAFSQDVSNPSTANTGVQTDVFGGSWLNTSAITTITLTLASGNFVSGSTITLWGEADTGPVLLTANSNLIQETILTAAQATIPIPNIPQGYRDLRIEVEARSAATGQGPKGLIQVNGDTTAADYDNEFGWTAAAGGGAGTDYGEGSVTTDLGIYAFGVPGTTATTGRAGVATLYIPDYAGSTWQKTIRYLWESPSSSIFGGKSGAYGAGRWFNTAPVTSLTLLTSDGSNFLASTVVRVYGEPAAAGGSSVGTGTRTRISANQSIPSGTVTAITWNTNDQDANNQHLLNPTPGALSGTVAKTAASNQLVGTTTTFLTQVAVGQVIQVPGTATETFVVTAIADNTHLTLNANAVNTATGQTATTINTAIVFRQAGMYDVEFGAYLATVSTGTVAIQVRLNGSTIIAEADLTSINAAAGYNVKSSRPFQQWDYVEALVTQSSGSAVNLTADERTHFAASGRPTVVAAVPYICIQEQESSGTSGGTFTSGAWQTRVLNTVVSDMAGVSSLASNQITLPPGFYRVNISCPANDVALHQARLQNITDGVTVLSGTSEQHNSGSPGSNRSFIVGKFQLTGTKTLAVQHQCNSTVATSGFGNACSFGTEVYTSVEIWKEG